MQPNVENKIIILLLLLLDRNVELSKVLRRTRFSTPLALYVFSKCNEQGFLTLKPLTCLFSYGILAKSKPFQLYNVPIVCFLHMYVSSVALR